MFRVPAGKAYRRPTPIVLSAVLLLSAAAYGGQPAGAP